MEGNPNKGKARRLKKIKPDCKSAKDPNSSITLTWDVDETSKKTLYEDMGVTEILAVSEGSDENSKSPDLQFVSPQETVLVPTNAAGKLNPQKIYSYPGSGDQLPFIINHLHNSECPIDGGKVDPFSTLSDEIILNVFKWLPLSQLAKCARVCRRWSTIVFDETLWKRANLSLKRFESGQVGRIFLRGATAVKLAKCDIMGKAFEGKDAVEVGKDDDVIILRRKSRRCIRVQYLDMSHCHVAPDTVADLLSKCYQLEKLSLEFCELNLRVFESLCRASQLDTVNLCMCKGLPEYGVGHFLARCQKLTTLNISWTDLDRASLTSVVDNLPLSLQKLNISGFRHLLTDNDVCEIARRCPDLLELDISDSALLHSTSIHFIMNTLHKLLFIGLSRCYNIPTSVLVELGAMPNLIAANFFGMVQDATLQNIRAAMPKVEVNKYPFSSIGRPTTGLRRSSIWGIKCWD
ncbi:S-phase kinase-associated protein 2-like [Ptychodera flava]|uniref:S-phase kinase-associated protein 2-like n=1 Tax=Ptychodera flava TaxID=63121 RepID=UPI00396A2436